MTSRRCRIFRRPIRSHRSPPLQGIRPPHPHRLWSGRPGTQAGPGGSSSSPTSMRCCASCLSCRPRKRCSPALPASASPPASPLTLPPCRQTSVPRWKPALHKRRQICGPPPRKRPVHAATSARAKSWVRSTSGTATLGPCLASTATLKPKPSMPASRPTMRARCWTARANGSCALNPGKVPR